MYGEQCSSIDGVSDEIPPIFVNCSKYFITGKDEIYADCPIKNGTDPCYLLKELHRSDSFIGSSTFMSVTGTYITLTIVLYLAVAHHISYMTTVTLKHCWLLIALIWFLSTVSSVFVALFGATLFYPDSAPISCSFESCQRPLAISIVVTLSICYGTVIGLYIAMMTRLHRLVRKSSLVQARSNSNSMIAMRRLSLNMITFAVGSIPILVVCIVALANLRELSSLGEGCKSPCKAFLYSYLFIDVEMLASIAAIDNCNGCGSFNQHNSR
ncbi:hypothetical protein L5515_004289 [Caenorhabditis briggsae]|uniref:G-protein coupled receptors family 1 profile domain-containing protein n=1 Tax=Caenorhabditis briggsae TaxID=6238 RepID=A0AAE9JD93_CAEBR|nr:hypothetical protein L5515_004289 [Caenorhabditis briggsae]